MEVEAAAVEQDGDTEVLSIGEASGGGLDPLNLAVDAFRGRVRDAVTQIGEDVGEVGLDHPGDLLDRLDARADRPSVPPVEQLPGPGWGGGVPKIV